jgi:hypothetical protein
MHAVMHNQYIGSYYQEKCKRHGHYPILKINTNAAAMIFGHAKNIIGT